MTPLRAASLGSLSWLAHGFGTRQDGYWTPESSTAKLHQVHGTAVIAVNAAGHFGDGDALITATPNVWLEIRTADCVPILVADRRQKVVAAVHAGWRGTAAGIVTATIERLVSDWGIRPTDLVAGIGPHISACCFEVGDDVACHFAGHITQHHPRPHVDLGDANRAQLIAAGLSASQIEMLGRCTCCEEPDFFSFRRDKGAGRMVSSVAIRSEG